MLKLLRNVRRAYKQWKALPAEEREQLASEVAHIRELVRELGGSRALQFVESEREETDAEVGDDGAGPQRERAAVIAELQDATGTLLVKMATPAGRLASESVPRSVTLGGRMMSAGVRRLARKHGGA